MPDESDRPPADPTAESGSAPDDVSDGSAQSADDDTDRQEGDDTDRPDGDDRDRQEGDDTDRQPDGEENTERNTTGDSAADPAEDVADAGDGSAREGDTNEEEVDSDADEEEVDSDADEEEVDSDADEDAIEADTDGDTPSTDGGSTASAGVVEGIDRGTDADEGVVSDIGDDEDDEFISAPEEDEEMPLADHINEMMRRLGVVFLFGGIATLIAYPYSPDLVNYLWGTHIPSPEVNAPRIYGPLEFILTKLKVAGLAGLLIGLPVFVYQTYRFMKPGLYRNERRYYLASVPTSLILAIVGVLFAHFIILPFVFNYFTTYTTDAASVAFGLRETFAMMLALMGYMAIIFQIPLFIMLAIMMGLVTRQWLENKRLIFWGLFVGIAFTFTAVDPTGMAPIIIALTMIVLFEGTLALLRWTGN